VIDKLQDIVDVRFGAPNASKASKKSLETTIKTLLPAQCAVAVGQVGEAQAQLDKTII
jgi:hypothetical protein